MNIQVTIIRKRESLSAGGGPEISLLMSIWNISVMLPHSIILMKRFPKDFDSDNNRKIFLIDVSLAHVRFNIRKQLISSGNLPPGLDSRDNITLERNQSL
jgi:hypothetical protein